MNDDDDDHFTMLRVFRSETRDRTSFYRRFDFIDLFYLECLVYSIAMASRQGSSHPLPGIYKEVQTWPHDQPPVWYLLFLTRRMNDSPSAK